MAKNKIAIIGGTGLEKLFQNAKSSNVQTPYGKTVLLISKTKEGKEVIFLPRHGLDHDIPPHMVNYRANIFALHKLQVERILATNAVGAINANFKPGDVVVPHDFVDFTKLRPSTFHDKAPVTHIDLSEPYCPEMRKVLIENSRKLGLHVWDRAVLVCTEGPRLETAAEIGMFRCLGFDVVGMTGFPEAVLARELEICYATICYVSNMAAGMQKRLTALELSRVSTQILPKIEQVLTETIKFLPVKRGSKCPCANALKNARFK